MTRFTSFPLILLMTSSWCLISNSQAQEKKEQPKKTTEVWTNPEDKTLPIDFSIQGEYLGTIASGEKLGCQVIALNRGKFQAVVLPGGLPGAGWDGKNKILMEGDLDGETVNFKPTTGKRTYIKQSPAEFSATVKYPPVGHKEYSAVLKSGTMTGKTDDGKTFELKKTTRVSPTMGAKPPSGALVMYDGTNTDEWMGGRIDKVTGLMNTDGKDITSKRKFMNYTVHVEFMIPFRPEARSQGRGNSGFYQVHLYEVQILDSFGLDGRNNECGGIYTKAEPKVNMCLPPLTWQTYDIEFSSAIVEDKKKTKPARITVKHNGVVIHENYDINGPTGGARNEPEGTPGPLILQGHGNPVQFRNIWVVEKK